MLCVMVVIADSRQQTADSRQLTQDSLDRRGVVSATVGLPPVAGVEGLLDDVDTHLQVHTSHNLRFFHIVAWHIQR